MEVMSLTLLIVLIIILIVGGIVLYFLPAIIAYKEIMLIKE